MEELGRALIDSLAGPFLEQWVGAVGTPPGAERAVSAIAHQAVASAVEDPELMRFILAEQRGAIPAFRAALASKLAVVSAAVQRAILAEMPKSGSSPEPVADAVVVLMLGACAEALDHGPEHSAALSERLVAQIRWVLSGAGVKGKP
jgi:hypothetical protein